MPKGEVVVVVSSTIVVDVVVVAGRLVVVVRGTVVVDAAVDGTTVLAVVVVGTTAVDSEAATVVGVVVEEVGTRVITSPSTRVFGRGGSSPIGSTPKPSATTVPTRTITNQVNQRPSCRLGSTCLPVATMQYCTIERPRRRATHMPGPSPSGPVRRDRHSVRGSDIRSFVAFTAAFSGRHCPEVSWVPMDHHAHAPARTKIQERPRRSSTAIDVEIDQHRIVFDTVDRAVRLLDPIGALIWRMLDGEASLAELSDSLSSAFGVPRADIEADVSTFVRALSGNGLLADARVEQPEPTEQDLVLPNPPSP